MNRLESISRDLVDNCPMGFTRIVFHEVSLKRKLTGIIGGRAVGKTSLLLQLMKSKVQKDERAIYINLDDVYFCDYSLIGFAEDFYRRGGNYLFIDDAHKYPDFDNEISQIIGQLADLHVVFSSLSLSGDKHDWISQNSLVDIHYLPGLSYREFLELRYQMIFPAIKFDELVELNRNPGVSVLNRIRPNQYFDEYLWEGYFPLGAEREGTANSVVSILLNKVLEGDIPSLYNIDYSSVRKIKKLLFKIASNGPMKPNIEKIAREADTTRDSILKFFTYLESSGIINIIYPSASNSVYKTKPERLYLNNSNLIKQITLEVKNKESLYETFLVNQLKISHEISITGGNDILVDDLFRFKLDWIESKAGTSSQNFEYYKICADRDYQDDILIPLWMFGFLY